MILPGLIDPHVHLRDPGQTHKEDFTRGTAAALAGGYTAIIDMPNNLSPIISEAKLDEKIQSAKDKIMCDVGFHFGSLGNNFDEFEKVKSKINGLKIYLNQTTGNFIVDEKVFRSICNAWKLDKPILVHAEENVLESIINIANRAKRQLHVCHVSSEKELEIIINAKTNRARVTCGVTPHHLFLTRDDELNIGNFAKMKPSLKSKKNVNFLWDNLKHIDCIESDHAPHTKEEKESENPPFGIPGLETTLPLLLTAMNDGKITKEEIIEKCFSNPKKIFNLPDQPDTYVDVDETEEWTIRNENLYTKCKWTPFDGWRVKGKVKRVTIRGTKVFEDGKILATLGFGEIIKA
jgi:dihydroorotase (multifunctional complex type)